MSPWQRRARVFTAVFGVVVAILVARGLKRRTPAPDLPPVVRVDPSAIVEGTGARTERSKGPRETFTIESEHQFTYADGTAKLTGLKIRTTSRDEPSRAFTVTGDESKVGQNESAIAVDGHVTLRASDGLVATMDRATYAKSDAIVRAPGVVAFTRGRVSGQGVGMIYDNNTDVLTLLEQAIVRIAPDEAGTGGIEVVSGTAVLARGQKSMRFERGVKITRPGEVIGADASDAQFSDDEKRIETVALHGSARIRTSGAAAGGVQSMSGNDMNLTYADDGQTLRHAQIVGNAVSTMAGQAGSAGREIKASVIDVALGPDGATPTALTGRLAVQLTFPPEAGAPGRTIAATNLDAKGEPGEGLKHATFTGSVQFRERGANVDRSATSTTLEVGLTQGMSTIEDAKFSQTVRFQDGRMTAQAAAARYDPDMGTLALSGSEPNLTVPHAANEQIAVDAEKINVTLEGPIVKAEGGVRSQLQPPQKSDKPGDAGNDVKLPSMLKQDQVVFVLADKLDYDGAKSKGVYTGSARLFQGDTSIKGGTILIDDKNGDLAVTGGVTSASVLESVDKDKKTTRTPSLASAKDLKYDDETRRLTYTGDAHLSGTDGDMTAGRIELFLKPSGNEVDRAEAYDGVTLREQGRKTTGTRLSYTSEDEKYIVTGTPVTIVDTCGRENVGRTLTFVKSTDLIVLDGNGEVRTQNKNGGKCP
ncbi:MAG: LPS export ABC transporter periplasmic protein LptC [Acidobacteria bacterium]|nr:LPS export ABC transporter periplasmic protein LptC [Acidobacteriota bacterium]